jgi:hypothetical protein
MSTRLERLRRFTLKHFDFSTHDLLNLDRVLTILINEHDLDGISEFDLIELIDDEFFKLERGIK